MKKAMTIGLIAVVLTALFLLSPAVLSAKERRGATVVVTRTDGRQFWGELIAVKPDTLLLISGDKDLSIAFADIRSVRVVRKSRAGLLAGIGGAAGFVGMGGFVLIYGEEDVFGNKAGAALLFGVLTGAAGGLAGALVGSALGVDSYFEVAGKPEPEVADYWRRLGAFSREGRLPETGTPPVAAPGLPREPGIAGSKAPPAAAAGRLRRPRFRLSLSGEFADLRGASSLGGQSSFRFPEETGPEAGPYPMNIDMTSFGGHNHMALGPFGLACELTERWLAEVEFLLPGRWYVNTNGAMAFTSSLDGLTYQSEYYGQYRANLVAVLLGLVYRPLVPSALQRHSLEAGAAIGPAIVHAHESGIGGAFSLPSVRKVGVCGRAMAAYDFYITPAFFVGAFVGYRHLRTELTGVSSSGLARFWATTGPAQNLDRMTEVSLPALPVKASGSYWGFRGGGRF